MLEVFTNGGPVMIPLGIASVMAVAIIVERSWNLRAQKILPPEEVKRLYALVDSGEFERAEEYASSRPGALNNTLLPALEARRESREYRVPRHPSVWPCQTSRGALVALDT